MPGPAPRVTDEPGLGALEVWDLDTSEAFLESLLTDLFTNHWRSIVFGPMIQGAAWEIGASEPPTRVGLADGYLTVDFGRMHFHLCIGEHRGSPARPTPPALARHRRTRRAELYRRVNEDGAPDSWGLRLFNGRDEEQVTVLFPNPFLTDALELRPAPDWSRLALWDHVRARYLGLPPDPRDRAGRRFVHP
jgi:hypothetical protein